MFRNLFAHFWLSAKNGCAFFFFRNESRNLDTLREKKIRKLSDFKTEFLIINELHNGYILLENWECFFFFFCGILTRLFDLCILFNLGAVRKSFFTLQL